MVFTLPLAVFLINLACSTDSCTLQLCPVIPMRLTDYFDLHATLIYIGWILIQAAIATLPLGKVVEGLQLRTGQKLRYRCNALFALMLSVAGFATLLFLGFPITYVYHKYLQLITTAVVFAFLLSVLLYAHSFYVAAKCLAVGGNSGYLPYDFFMGRELNPRLGRLDLKFLCELRPGLIGWVLLDLCFLTEAYRLTGSVSPAMVLVVAFHSCYVIDALWFEVS
ncbi:Delta(14)-sterol reductase LBR [Lamellibrachia satsuma]|nr:Delta(14)-sterol reductase LBR [Lamellibrachia satsuma]